MTHLLRSLIRETLLLEEVYGAQAVVYHGTKADPRALISALLNDEFKAGAGGGALYGMGLYTVYDPDGARTMTGFYGDHVIKLKVNLYGYIIFDPGTALKVYKRPLTLPEQAEEVGYSDTVVEVLRSAEEIRSNANYTSEIALSVYKVLQKEVKGLVYTKEGDGKVVVVYDPTTAVPMAWKRVSVTKNLRREPVEDTWKSVDRASLLAPLDRTDASARERRPVQQSALRRSALGDFEADKWDPLTVFKHLERLPEDQRVVKGDLDLSDVKITSLPTNLKVNGFLFLQRTPITNLPAGLKVDGNLDLSRSRVASISAGLRVGRNLNLYGTPVTSLPTGLQVGGNLNLSDTSITSLPADLEVGGKIFGLDSKYHNDVPERLKDKLQ